MAAAAINSKQEFQTFEIVKEQQIAAPIDIVFETILEQMGPMNSKPDGPMPMTLEAWPGGRWFRDFGNDTGHFWGVVQAIKAPTLLEIHGPLFMSSPAVSNIQYRLSEQDGVTTLRFAHRCAGWLLPEYFDINSGWTHMMAGIQAAIENKMKGK